VSDSELPRRELASVAGWIAAGAFFLVYTAASWARWANFDYRTFDLAYYVQTLWQLIHGQLDVSVEHVPLLGNHVEPIVLLIAPFFAIVRHPMLFVAVQNAALAAMGPLAYDIGRRLGFSAMAAALLALALLLAPATGYIALHEFHAEAFAAPLFLLMYRARLAGSRKWHWVWFVALLACKENMALLLATYCAVSAVIERRRPLRDLAGWFLWPMAAAITWLALCVLLITPALNAGNIDYFGLYSRLGDSPRDVLSKFFTEPSRVIGAIRASVAGGNLLPGLLLPFLALPLLRPRWLLIAMPILLQHLLSSRSSEWTIYFHYAAPLLPLVWIALAEAIARFHASSWRLPPRIVAAAVVAACIASQIFLGPAAALASATSEWQARKTERDRKRSVLQQIPAAASVMAPLPYLSHLATRSELYSLHYVLKGLKTLSRERYEPPPPPHVVLIDYGDSATFDPVAGYYHPRMRTAQDQTIPSSDRLLHELLRQAEWRVDANDQIALFTRVASRPNVTVAEPSPVLAIDEHTQLLSITKSAEITSGSEPLVITFVWSFNGERDVFPWMLLKLTPHAGGPPALITKGLCAPEARDGLHEELWRVSTSDMPDGTYDAEAVFVDNTKRSWAAREGQATTPPPLLGNPVSLGQLTVKRRP
jgi:uncharacterized membrane protein